MNRSLWLCLTLLAPTVACDKHTDHVAPGDHHDHAAPEHPAPAATPTPPATAASNPVQAEMRLLSAAMETAVRGIGAGDVRELGHALHRVHSAKEATAKALEQGAYRPPKNGENTARFRELDEAFHHELERLVSASQDNNVGATAEAMGNALKACHGCHAEFRL